MIEMAGRARPTSIAEIGLRACRDLPAAPILRVYPFRHISMKRGIRPIAYPRDMPMFHRIPMNGIDVTAKITKAGRDISSRP